MERTDKKNLIAALAKSTHGELSEYATIAGKVLVEDPDFYAHLMAWNHRKGQVRDAKVALPVLGLFEPTRDPARFENALAHMADLNPRLFLQALDFARTVKSFKTVGKRSVIAQSPSRVLKRLVTRYLRDMEADAREWDRTALRHRTVMKTLYARYHVKPSDRADNVLFKRTALYGAFLALKSLAAMTGEEAAGAIMHFKLPFLSARGAVGKKAADPSVAMALIKAASPTELVTNAKAFDRLGIKTIPALRAAFDEALEKAGKSKHPRATLKTTRAAEVLADDEKLSGKLRALQETQLTALSVDGDWLVLGDKSGSMHDAIEGACLVAATLAKMVKGRVHLIFFDTTPRYFDATGKTYEELKKYSNSWSAGGGTSIGCGLRYMLDKKLSVDGIAVVSDGGENHPPDFAETYKKYCDLLAVEPTLYFYRFAGDGDAFSGNCSRAKLDVQTFDLRGSKVDFYSLPNLVQTMRVGRYQLLDDVMNMPLLTLNDVLERTMNLSVLPTLSPVIV